MFVFDAGDGADTISDFTDGEDLIDLRTITGITEFNDLTVTASGNDVLITMGSDDGGGTIPPRGHRPQRHHGRGFLLLRRRRDLTHPRLQRPLTRRS